MNNTPKKKLNKQEELKNARKKQWIVGIGNSRKNRRIDLLGIDPATNCGWASSDGKYGVWDLTRGKHESDGMKWLRFRKILTDIINDKKIKVVAYEAPSGTHINAVIHHAKLVAIIEETCESLHIECIGYNVKTIKVFATDNGNSNKTAMIAAASKLFGYEGDNDNEADAICILNLLKSQI